MSEESLYRALVIPIDPSLSVLGSGVETCTNASFWCTALAAVVGRAAGRQGDFSHVLPSHKLPAFTSITFTGTT